jgi:hypothetical protein
VPTSAHYRFPCSSTKLFFKLFNYLLNTSFSSILLNIFVPKFFLHVFTNFQLPDTVNGLLPPTVAPISSADSGHFQKVQGQQTTWAAPERISASSSDRTGRAHIHIHLLTRRVLTPSPLFLLDDAKAGSNHLKSKITPSTLLG